MRTAAIVLGIGLALAGWSAASASASLTSVTSDTLDRSIAVTWSELAATPCAYQGREVRFTIQFHGRLDRWVAGPTRFGPGAFAAISAWSDEQFPWYPAEFENPAARLFTRLDTEVERTLQSARPHQRFAVRGIVRDAWRNRPWVELTSAIPLDEEIGEATVFHAARALERMSDGSFEIADEALQQAVAAPMPPHAREELGRLRQICAQELADPQPEPIRPRGMRKK